MLLYLDLKYLGLKQKMKMENQRIWELQYKERSVNLTIMTSFFWWITLFHIRMRYKTHFTNTRFSTEVPLTKNSLIFRRPSLELVPSIRNWGESKKSLLHRSDLDSNEVLSPPVSQIFIRNNYSSDIWLSYEKKGLRDMQTYIFLVPSRP